MKNNILKCAAFAIVSAFALSMPSTTQGMVPLPKPASPMFGSNFGFLQGLFGEENSVILAELWNRLPQVEPIVRTAIEDLIEHGNWMSTNLAGAQSQNWRTFNTGLFDTIVNGPSKTGEEWWKHGQKHIFSIRTDEAQQSAQAGVFGMGNISSKVACNTIAVEMIRDRFFVDWYQKFFSFEPNATPMEKVIVKFLKQCDSDGIFEGLESFREVAETEEFSKYMSLFSAFVLYPRNKEVIYGIISKDKRLSQFARVVEGGSVLATAMTIALGKHRFDWVYRNLEPFFFLYQFADVGLMPLELEKDYEILMPSFLGCFPTGKWVTHGREFPELTRKMDNFLLAANAYSSGMLISEIVRLGFNQAMPHDIVDYIYYASPTLEEIAKIKNDYGQVKAKDKKKMQQEFRKNFLYPALRKYVSERDSSLIQEFDRKHEGGNINTIIRDLREIINQINKPIESQIAPQG